MRRLHRGIILAPMLLLPLLFGCDDGAAGDFALAFDGPPACGTVAVDGGVPDSFTMEVWMRGDPDSAHQLRPLAMWSGIFEFYERDDGILIFGVGDQHVSASYAFTQMDGVLHHLAGTYDGADGRVRLWVDGKLEGQNTAFVAEPDERIQIGCAKEYTEAFSGLLDEVRLSSTVRYDSDFERPTTPFVKDDDTIMLFHLDEGTGETSESAVGDFVMELSDTSWLEFSLASSEEE